MQSLSNTSPNNKDELHHFFVANDTARNGGIEEITLRNGKSYAVKIPSNLSEGTTLRMPKTGTKGNDTLLTLHTLHDVDQTIETLLFQEPKISALKAESQQRCKSVYNVIKQAKPIEDIAALDLLDFIIDTWIGDVSIKELYTIASQNSRLLKIEELLEEKIESIDTEWQEILRGAYQTVRAGDFIDNFQALEHLDFLVQSLSIPEGIKQFYIRFSIVTRATTFDALMICLISEYFPIETERSLYLTAYKQMRDGKKAVKTQEATTLERFVLNSSLPEECKVIYKLIQDPISESNNSDDLISKVQTVFKSVKKSSNVIPQANTVFGVIGVKAGTGVAISGLSGAAATNATLAALGGGSVAAGGLGMLGGLTVATGGAALLGAAALVCVVSTSQMSSSDKINIGVAAGAGFVASAATVTTIWAAVSTFGIAGTGTAIGSLSGAAATSAVIAALGGVGTITGGAALIAVGAGYAVWRFLKVSKDDPQKMLVQMEERLYR